MTVKELARIAGIAPPVVSRVERGLVEDPRLSTAPALARALECTVEDIFVTE